MQRREFIAGLGSAAAWPVVARAQQADRIRRVGVLRLEPVYDQFTQTSIAALREGLEALGWKEGRNLQLDIRFAGGDPNAVGPYADELVNLAPGVIVVSANMVTTSVQRRTRTIPIIFVGGGDPVVARAEGRKPPAQGQPVTFHVQPDDVFAFYPETGERLIG